MPSTTDKKISSEKLLGPASTSLFSAKGKGPVGANAPLIIGNQKAIKINARKISILKNIVKGRGEKIWKGESIGEKLPGGEGLGKTLNDIANNMDSIKNTIVEQQRVDKGIAEDERKAAEKASRGKQEKDLEGKFSGLRQTAAKVLAPVTSVWEKIINFITTVLLGKVAIKLFSWFADKENKKKVEAIGRFLKDFWPTLLAAYLMFGNALGRFVTGIIGKVVIWTVKIVATVIPALIKALAKMKWGKWGKAGLIVGGVVAAGYGISKLMGGGDDKPTPSQEQATTTDGSTEKQVRKLDQGGAIQGPSHQQGGVPLEAEGGEFVMSRGAVNKWGLDTLENMNAMGGGTNIPMMDDETGTTFAAGGGLIGGIKSMFGGIKNAVGKMFGGGGGGGEQSSKGALTGLSGDDYKDLAFIVSAEARRGTEDEYGVAANVLNRVADPRYPNTIKEVGSEPGQYEAVFTGKAYDDPELAIKLASPEGQAGIAAALQRLQGRTDFKGTSQYGNMGKGDILFAPSGNFYHYAEQFGKSDPPPKSIPTHWKKFIGGKSGGGIGSQSSIATPGTSGGGASISAPPPPPPAVGPPVPQSSVAAYAHQHKKKKQTPPPLNGGAPQLPPIDPAAMVSMSKVKVLGITV